MAKTAQVYVNNSGLRGKGRVATFEIKIAFQVATIEVKATFKVATVKVNRTFWSCENSLNQERERKHKARCTAI